MYGGKPVPSGSLRFIPDFDKGNRGTATTIMITEGTYRSVDGWNTRGGHGQVKNLPPRGPATMLHCLGVDHVRLTFRFGGRDVRLTDVEGRVLREILG